MKLLHWIQKQRNQKDGFTLVELIVVLVILAILAALLVPALTGYIDKAKEKQVIAETRSLLTAVQTETVDLYSQDILPKSVSGMASPVIAAKNGNGNGVGGSLTSDQLKENYQRIVSLSELPSLQGDGNGRFACAVNTSGKVGTLIYDNGKGYVGLYFSETNEYLAIPSSADLDNSYLSSTNSCKVVIADTYFTYPDDPTLNVSYWGRYVVLLTLARADLL